MQSFCTSYAEYGSCSAILPRNIGMLTIIICILIYLSQFQPTKVRPRYRTGETPRVVKTEYKLAKEVYTAHGYAVVI